MKYFGKTTRPEKEMLTYCGSGVIWKRHIKKYGVEHVKTIWYSKFDNVEDCSDFAILFSEEADIVNSTHWANLIIENGLSGAPKGSIISEERRAKQAISRRGKAMGPQSEETCHKKSISMKGKNTGPQSIETRLKNSLSKIGIKRKPFSDEHRCNLRLKGKERNLEILVCPHCGQTGGAVGLRRWHFDNCRDRQCV